MKTSPRPPKTPSRLSESVYRQLNVYALAASAAGVSLLALTEPSAAEIIYTKTHIVIGTKHIYHLDLNHDGITDFRIKNSTFTSDFHHESLYALPAQPHNGAAGASQSGARLAFALRRGAIVGPKQPFSGVLMAASTSGPLGQWVNVNGRYLGLRFLIKGKVHYGWARMNVNVAVGKTITATLTGYAYETIPSKPIVAGETKGPHVITPASASLGRLARGSDGPARRSTE
jgi:hypothetical protein